MTSLFSGMRVSKDHQRIKSYGTVDEFNASIGMCASVCDAQNSVHGRFLEIFAILQSRLFDIGADLATPPGTHHESKIRRIAESDVAEIESWIDEIDAQNSPLKAFVMPGGCELASRVHLARTICRRAEREVIQLSHTEPVGVQLMIFINRVSDLLFAMARLANHSIGMPDVPWKPSRS